MTLSRLGYNDENNNIRLSELEKMTISLISGTASGSTEPTDARRLKKGIENYIEWSERELIGSFGSAIIPTSKKVDAAYTHLQNLFRAYVFDAVCKRLEDMTEGYRTKSEAIGAIDLHGIELADISVSVSERFKSMESKMLAKGIIKGRVQRNALFGIHGIRETESAYVSLLKAVMNSIEAPHEVRLRAEQALVGRRDDS